MLAGGTDLKAYGNALANPIFGNAGNNILDGRGGADAMIGAPATTATASTMPASR